MKTVKRVRKAFAVLAALISAFLSAGLISAPVQAAGGNVYTCVIHPCYAHPVTGVIEDSGGEASYATGQGMVEGAVYTTGILEVTDSGEYYLTIRLSLMSYTSGHSFWVQNVGDSGWSSPALGVTGNGTDNNGETADVCIQVPSENCVVRASMYVEPMGRDVIFYLYPSDYTAGNSTDMNATIVTSASGSGTSASGAAAADGTGSTGSGSTGSGSTGSGSAGTAGSGSSLQGSTGLSASGSSDTDSSTEETAGSDAPALSSSIEEAAVPSADSASDAELGSAQGLSLSTAGDASGAEEAGSSGGSGAFAVGAAVTVSGLILMGAAALIVYFFRKNWRRWGGGYDDEED